MVTKITPVLLFLLKLKIASILISKQYQSQSKSNVHNEKNKCDGKVHFKFIDTHSKSINTTNIPETQSTEAFLHLNVISVCTLMWSVTCLLNVT